jgi:cytochrome c biogenesis protein CcmG, thiol:disulfide interchange protein DsbE
MAAVTSCSSGPVISALYGALAFLVLAGGGCAGHRSSEGRSSDVGSALTLSAPDLDGKEVDVGAQQGHVRVVDFWATWCEPCKEALPALDALAKDLAPRGLAVYGVSIDEDREQLSRFLAERPVGFTVLWDRGAVRVSRYHVTYMPITLLIDRAGVIRHVHQGWEAGRAELERREVEALLSERPASARAP